MTSAFLSTSNILVCTLPSCILERGFEWGDLKGLSPPGLQVCHATSWEKICVGYQSHFCQVWGAYTRCFHFFSIFVTPGSPGHSSEFLCHIARQDVRTVLRSTTCDLNIFCSPCIPKFCQMYASDMSWTWMMHLVMHSAAMPEALFYAHSTANGVKLHVLFWIILIFYCICCASVPDIEYI